MRAAPIGLPIEALAPALVHRSSSSFISFRPAT
jgi:hypothetical protein